MQQVHEATHSHRRTLYAQKCKAKFQQNRLKHERQSRKSQGVNMETVKQLNYCDF